MIIKPINVIFSLFYFVLFLTFYKLEYQTRINIQLPSKLILTSYFLYIKNWLEYYTDKSYYNYFESRKSKQKIFLQDKYLFLIKMHKKLFCFWCWHFLFNITFNCHFTQGGDRPFMAKFSPFFFAKFLSASKCKLLYLSIRG